MKRQIRRNVFETNSSSVHSLTLRKYGKYDENKLTITDDNYIEVKLGTFGKDKNEHIYKGQNQKLSYLMTFLYYTCECKDNDVQVLYHDWNFEKLQDIICEYTKTKGIRIRTDKKPFMASHPNGYDWIELIDISDKNDVLNYLFNSCVSLKSRWEDDKCLYSLHFSRRHREKNKLEMNKKGEIVAHYGDFGKAYEIFDSQNEKLSYLISCLWYLCSGYNDDMYQLTEFKNIENAVCKYTGAKRIIIDDSVDPEIDHQSIPYKCIEIIDTYDEEQILDFIFNKDVVLKTNCD